MATGGHEDSHYNGNSGPPKFETLVPNRIFVGGISGNTNDEDLRSLFAKYGNVKGTKIILDSTGISRGYGFVTFETEEEAHQVLQLCKEKEFKLKERTLNIATAKKKQPYGRVRESNTIHAGPVIWPGPQTISGLSNYSNRESLYYQQAPWSVVWPQQYYLQQQCHYPSAPPTGYPQYVYSIAPPEYPFQSLGQLVSGSDYSETSSADSSETGKSHSKQNTSTPSTSDYERNRTVQSKSSSASPTTSPYRYTGCGGHADNVQFHNLHHHVLAKTVNGMAVMAYPSSLVMGSPTILHMKDPSSGDHENVMTELEFLQSPIAPGGPTPPPTPLAAIPCDFGSNTSMESIRKN